MKRREETRNYINALMLQFRELVVGVQKEHDHYQKLASSSKNRSRNSMRSMTNNLPPLPIQDEPTSSSSPSSNRALQNNRALINQIRAVMASPASTATTRGALIVLEGLDRVGKSTLARKLVEHLEKSKKPVTHCRFPDRTTPVGRMIDDFLTSSKRVDSHVMHLLFSANRWELAQHIKNTINQGKTVIVDRYSYSGIAYSSAKKGLTFQWCCEMEKGLPKPDLVVYLELPREAQYKRPGFGDERYETREMQELVRIQYGRVMEHSKETWLKINVQDKTPDQVLGELVLPVKRCIESCSNKELGTLDFFHTSDNEE